MKTPKIVEDEMKKDEANKDEMKKEETNKNKIKKDEINKLYEMKKEEANKDEFRKDDEVNEHMKGDGIRQKTNEKRKTKKEEINGDDEENEQMKKDEPNQLDEINKTEKNQVEIMEDKMKYLEIIKLDVKLNEHIKNKTLKLDDNLKIYFSDIYKTITQKSQLSTDAVAITFSKAFSLIIYKELAYIFPYKVVKIELKLFRLYRKRSLFY